MKKYRSDDGFKLITDRIVQCMREAGADLNNLRQKCYAAAAARGYRQRGQVYEAMTLARMLVNETAPGRAP